MKAERGIKYTPRGQLGTVVIVDIKGNKTIPLMLGPDISSKRCKCAPSSPIGLFARFVRYFGPHDEWYCCVALDILNHHRPQLPTWFSA